MTTILDIAYDSKGKRGNFYRLNPVEKVIIYRKVKKGIRANTNSSRFSQKTPARTQSGETRQAVEHF